MLAQHGRARRQWVRLPLPTAGTQLVDEVSMQLAELDRPHFAVAQVGLLNRLHLPLPGSLKVIRLLLRRLQQRILVMSLSCKINVFFKA